MIARRDFVYWSGTAFAILALSTTSPNTAQASVAFCARENHYSILGIELFLKARKLSGAEAVAAKHHARDLLYKADDDPDFGDHSITSCDAETQEARSAAIVLLDLEESLHDPKTFDNPDLSVTYYLDELETFRWPNRFLSASVFQNLILEAIAAMRARHEAFDKAYISGGDSSDSLSVASWKAFFVRWLGYVPSGVLPEK